MKLANLADSSIRESSGVAASRRYPDPLQGIVWTHNDSGNRSVLYATNRRGAAINQFWVDAPNIDWEDIAEGPGVDGSPALYIADIGDNQKARTEVMILRVAEPYAYGGPPTFALYPDRLRFAYPGGARYDAETLLIDPRTVEAFIVTKDSGGVSRVFKSPGPLTTQTPGELVTLVQVATVRFSSWMSYGRMATGGDIAADGSKLVIRTYTHVYEWPIKPGQSVAQALTFNARRSFSVPFEQGESVCYRPDDRALLLTSEKTPCPLYELPPR